MDLKNEVDYRLAKVLLSNMYHDGVLTEKKRDRLWQALLDEFCPPYRCVEDVGGNIGEGFRISDIRARRQEAKKDG